MSATIQPPIQPLRFQSAFYERQVDLKPIIVPEGFKDNSEQYINVFTRKWNADIRNDDKNCWIFSWFTPLVLILITAIGAIMVRDCFPANSLRDTVITSIALIGSGSAIAAFLRLSILGPCGGCHRPEEQDDARTQKIHEQTTTELTKKFTRTT